jgi:TolB protein
MKNWTFGFLFSLVWVLPAWGKTVLQVEGARFRPLQIAVPDFVATSVDEKALALQMVKTIREDLDVCGVFKVLDPKSYIPNLKDWSSIGAEALVKTKFKMVGQDLKVEVVASQVGLTNESMSKSYQAIASGSGKLAHKISDDIYQYFTGEPGPFSTQIAAVKLTEQGKQIVLLDMDGKNPRQVTKASSINILPTIVPEGNAILYTSYMNKRSELFSIGVDGANLKSISARPGINTGASVSPDKTKIALTLSKDGDSEIYVANRDGSNPVRLTKSHGIDTSPSWSPDGKQIAFVSARSGNPQVYVMNADGSNPKRLTFQGKYNQTPRWSPKGNMIVFTGRDEQNVFDIFSVDPATSKVSRITQGQGSNEEPCFAPNGRLIAFTSTRNGSRDLYVGNLDGSFQRRITQNGSYWTPSWGPLP